MPLISNRRESLHEANEVRKRRIRLSLDPVLARSLARDKHEPFISTVAFIAARADERMSGTSPMQLLGLCSLSAFWAILFYISLRPRMVLSGSAVSLPASGSGKKPREAHAPSILLAMHRILPVWNHINRRVPAQI